jgi:hypothetical protein
MNCGDAPPSKAEILALARDAAREMKARDYQARFLLDIAQARTAAPPRAAA